MYQKNIYTILQKYTYRSELKECTKKYRQIGGILPSIYIHAIEYERKK